MAERPPLNGIHHVTAIASDAQTNLDFYVRFLGLRLVKQTVNFDDPGTYHFYYGDRLGRPGTLITFFPWAGTGRGRAGAGQVSATAFAVPAGALELWQQRVMRYGVDASQAESPWGERILRLNDPDGLSLELVETTAVTPEAEDGLEVPAEAAITGIARAELLSYHPEQTLQLLTNTLGYSRQGETGDLVRLTSESGSLLDVHLRAAPRGLGGAGTVHHIAFRTPTDEAQQSWIDTLTDAGVAVTPVMDRNYFRSIYFREPGGILYEIATDPPGFTVDEPADELGSTLKLPQQYEKHRDRIQLALPQITVPVAGVASESY
ncbi:MAG TPA: ring-cleaving dioxygenase [Bryobacteraceae bacterium]|nr:ring-cleaving dioxygenase [Bryobacteraceae bacterium]